MSKFPSLPLWISKGAALVPLAHTLTHAVIHIDENPVDLIIT